MTISANMHRVSAVMAEQHGDSTWLSIKGESEIERFNIFMPLKQAEMIAEAFDAYNNLDAEERYWTTREPDDRYTQAGLLATQNTARVLK